MACSSCFKIPILNVVFFSPHVNLVDLSEVLLQWQSFEITVL